MSQRRLSIGGSAVATARLSMFYTGTAPAFGLDEPARVRLEKHMEHLHDFSLIVVCRARYRIRLTITVPQLLDVLDIHIGQLGVRIKHDTTKKTGDTMDIDGTWDVHPSVMGTIGDKRDLIPLIIKVDTAVAGTMKKEITLNAQLQAVFNMGTVSQAEKNVGALDGIALRWDVSGTSASSHPTYELLDSHSRTRTISR
eukprot:Opistho-2@94251